MGSIGIVISSKTLARRASLREALSSKVALAGRQLTSALTVNVESISKRRTSGAKISKVRKRQTA